MNKKIFYGIILLITLSLSLGVVSASDNFANETIGASLETPTNDIQLETSGSNSASEIKEIEKTNSNLLGLSNEDVLGNPPITPEGNKFSDIAKEIKNCDNNSVIDLGNLTYTGIDNTNLQSTQKNITIQNGIIDGSKIENNAQIKYMYVTLKNIHFKNFNYIVGKWDRIFFFINSCKTVTKTFCRGSVKTESETCFGLPFFTVCTKRFHNIKSKLCALFVCVAYTLHQLCAFVKTDITERNC